ncbi:MAG: WXG100 family type VII secretion target [Mycobacterium sp.]
MSSAGTGQALTTDFDLMRAVAAKIETRNAELRGVLTGFIARMTAVPTSVWGGVAATRFKEVVDRWNGESTKLQNALDGIADTIRFNEQQLREAAQRHADQLAGIAAG